MGRYAYNKKQKQKRRRFFTGVFVLVLVTISTIGVQIFLNKNDEQAKAQNIQVTTAKDDEEAIEKEKEEEKKKSLVVEGLNVSEEGLQYADSGEFVETVVNNTYERDGKKVAYLTFDDGPSTTVTPKILDTLKNENVKATFFIVGQTLKDDNKEILKRIVAEGNALANHSYSHDYKKLYPGRVIDTNKVMEEYQMTNDKIREFIGPEFNTKVFRFPGGLMSWKGRDGIKAKFKENGIHYIDWNSLSGDAEGKKRTANELLERVKTTTKDQEKVVILMHDTYGKEATAEALPQVIQYLKSQGYEFRTIK